MMTVYERIQQTIDTTAPNALASKILTLLGEETTLLLRGLQEEMRLTVSEHLNSTDSDQHETYRAGAYRTLAHLNEQINFIATFMNEEVIL
jgi:hypothetical protein